MKVVNYNDSKEVRYEFSVHEAERTVHWKNSANRKLNEGGKGEI